MERTKRNLLQKLYSREIHGSFVRGHSVVHDKALKLFSSIPDRLMFYLKDVLQHMGNHILVGTTRCGQFLITYSYATDLRIPVQMYYKYRLHWWAFRPGAPAYKVAEVQLFDNQDITYALTVGIAQWSNVNDKLIAYGYSDDSDTMYEQEDGDVESRRYYITVTTLPSLHDCKDCKAVAESFDEEEMAANWDSCIGLSCLKHGLTIHTTLDIAPPYPKFDFLTNLKIDNKIIVNTGNFLHVLSFGSDKEGVKPSHDDNIVPEEICHKVGERLSTVVKDYVCPWKNPGSSSSLSSRRTLTHSVNKAWLNTIMDRAEKVYAFEEVEDGCEPRFKWFRKRRIADKMYEFCSDDEDMENIQPPEKTTRHYGPTTYFSSKMKYNYNEIMKSERLKDEVNKESELENRKTIKNTTTVKNFPGGAKSDVDMKENINFSEKPHCFVDTTSRLNLDDESDNKNEEGDCLKSPTAPMTSFAKKENIVLPDNPKYFIESIRAKRLEMECKRKREQSEVLTKGVMPSKTSNNCENNSECETEISKRLGESSSRYCDESHNVVDNFTSSYKTDCDNLSRLGVRESFNTPVSSTSNVDSLPSKSDYRNLCPLELSIIKPDLSAILAEWEAESVSSLSPKSDTFLHKNGETKNDVIQSFLELIPGMTISPHSSSSSTRSTDHMRTESGENLSPSPHSTSRTPVSSPLPCKYSPLLVVLRTRNCNQDKEPQKAKEQEDKCKGFSKEEVTARVKPGKDADLTMRQRMISGCSVRFDRIYIEVDEEIMSTITDIEDDDQGTGFHCALPLSVHGSAYAQLQMVSSHKAEKMNIHSERVYQTSLDIEQFCFKAADIICKCEGYKFWFCDDYDVEIIDVCAFNGDILGVVCLRVNAEKKPQKNERQSTVNQRYFYQVRCVFIWNPGTDRCWLEAYSHLVDVTKQVHQAWTPAKCEAAKLRKTLQTTTLFSLRPHPTIRIFAHRMWNDNSLVPSIEEIRDRTNLIGFRLIHVPRHLRRIFEFL